MLKAVVNDGEIQPLEPLPADWRQGQALRVEKAVEDGMTIEEIDRDFAALARLCQAGDDADDDKMQRALQEAHRQAKEQVRRQMGLS